MIKGTSAYFIASDAEPAIGCLIAIISTYPDTVLIVSANDSPLDTDDEPGSENPTTFPPNLFIADSKLSLVLVDGS